MFQVFVVEDDNQNVELLKRILKGKEYQLHFASNGEQAIEFLSDTSRALDAVLLDINLPKKNGIEVLSFIKNQSTHKRVPVIIQSSVSEEKVIYEGLNLGAYYYLTKPYSSKHMNVILRTAIQEYRDFIALESKVKEKKQTYFPVLKEGEFTFKRVEEVDFLLQLLIQATGEKETVKFGLSEILVNAIEHGNLEIDYDLKTNLLENNRLQDEIKLRSNDHRYKDRFAVIHFKHKEISDSGNFEIFIVDQGKGFNWKKYIDFDVSRIFDIHGRGIAKAKQQYFKKIEYKGKGNEVFIEF